MERKFEVYYDDDADNIVSTIAEILLEFGIEIVDDEEANEAPLCETNNYIIRTLEDDED